MNEVGQEVPGKHPLSSTWYKKKKKASPEDLKHLKSSTINFFERVTRTPSKFNGWTAYSDVKPALSGKGYARGWIANNARATNNFIDKKAMAYLCNWFYHPVIKRYFEERGVKVNEDAYALSCMIQWLWRSQIRCLKRIHVFVPSERMRGLLKDWLAGKGVSVELSDPAVQQSLAA